ncbi:MAG: cytochrome c peroxidase [Ferruginibacter sp.]
MLRKILVTGLLFFVVASLSFFTRQPAEPAGEVKQFYKKQALFLEQQIKTFKLLIATGNEKKLQQQFLKIRTAYKKIECIVTYYFDFSSIKLNGPPIPFFEEEESDLGVQQPAGMQVIEGFIFPTYLSSSKKNLTESTEELLRETQAMIQTTESFEFNDGYIFDAVMEELYRVTAMGITGFDAQASMNGLPESSAALNGVSKILDYYKTTLDSVLTGKSARLQQLLYAAQVYLDEHPDFNSFNRMYFIRQYLNPVTELVGSVKKKLGFVDNRSPFFYSGINKNNTLFAPSAFDVNKYLDDNTTSGEKIELGQKLFYEPLLSADGKRSCATCHNPAKAFTDGLATSTALDGHSQLTRNAPTLWNAALQRNLFLDNRSSSLEDQVMQVLNNAKEMHGSALDASQKIIQLPAYKELYAKAYKNASADFAALNICNAIACFERTLIALNSKFDKQMRGKNLMNKDEINGFNLFMGKAKCGTCHFAPLFNGSKPPRYYYNESEVIGVPENNVQTNNKLDTDEGRFIATGVLIHKFSFKTATLRNIALTAPYMHNGVFGTLKEVIEFYDKGGGKGLHIAPVNQTLPFEKLNLSLKEKNDIILFLKTLSDTVSTATPAH